MAVLDKGLVKLRAQIDESCPRRNRDSDGWIGDAAHQAERSDHNPEHPAPAGNPDFQVDALDVTHDPAHGADMGLVSEGIRYSRDSRVEYVIFNKRITGPRYGWRWTEYNGTDPHTNHMHVSVDDAHHDQTQDWMIDLMDSLNSARMASSEARILVLMTGKSQTWTDPRNGNKHVEPVPAWLTALMALTAAPK